MYNIYTVSLTFSKQKSTNTFVYLSAILKPMPGCATKKRCQLSQGQTVLSVQQPMINLGIFVRRLHKRSLKCLFAS